MEIYIKIYKDKPSRIGIKYLYEYLAVNTYQDLIVKHPGETFAIKIELLKGKLKLNLDLQANNTGAKISYKEIEYKLALFEKVNTLTNSSLPMEFVHLYSQSNGLFIAKPFNRQQFFPVTCIEIISPYGN